MSINPVLQSFLDALPSSACLINEEGVILEVNTAWTAFALENEGDLARVGVGADYLAACRHGGVGAKRALSRLREILAGDTRPATLEYPCHASDQKRWFNLTISPVRDLGEARALVIHTRISGPTPSTRDLSTFLDERDVVTGTVNRLLLRDRLSQALAAARETGDGVAVLALNIVDFGDVNAAFGYDGGDTVLREVATRLKEALPASYTVSRVSGDVFKILCVKLGREEDISTLFPAVQGIFAEPFTVPDDSVRLKAVIGVSAVHRSEDNISAETPMEEAFVALKRARRGGTDTVEFFSDQLLLSARANLRTIAEMGDALENDQFRLYLQPQVCARTARLMGAEALIRWQHPDRGLVPPGEFIPLVEQAGLASHIFNWVLEQTCAAIHGWGRNRGIHVSINLSPAQFRDAELPGRVMDAIARYAVKPECLRFEVTEDGVIHDMDRAVDLLERLAAIGSTICIDDFGTGMSSLAYLARLPARELKIDKSFVLGLQKDRHAPAIIRAVMQVAQAMDLNTVAEGVETAEHAEWLRQEKCDVLQGFHFGRPMPVADFERLWQNVPA